MRPRLVAAIALPAALWQSDAKGRSVVKTEDVAPAGAAPVDAGAPAGGIGVGPRGTQHLDRR